MNLTEIDEATVYFIIVEENGVKECDYISDHNLGIYLLELCSYSQATALSHYKLSRSAALQAIVNYVPMDKFAPTANINLARYIMDNNNIGPNGYAVGLKFTDIADAKAFCTATHNDSARYSTLVAQWFDRLNVLTPDSPCCFNAKKVVESPQFKALDEVAVHKWAEEVVKKSNIKRETYLSLKSNGIEEDINTLIGPLCEEIVMHPTILTHR